MIGSLIVRLVTIAIGYFLAVMAAAIFLSFGLFGEFLAGFYQGLDAPAYLNEGSIVFIGSYIAVAIGWTTLLPASILIAIAELMRWKSLTANLVLGGLCALFTGLVSFQGPRDAIPSESTLIVLLACGFIGGLVYWLIAGRAAGRWLSTNRPEST